MRIGELAARAGVNPKTVRFYEARGLLPDPPRLASGYRDYGGEAQARLAFIRTAQRLGFTLNEIREIISFRERGERPCDYVLSVLSTQVADLDRRIGELVALRAELVALKARADELVAEEGRFCSIVEHAAAAARSGGRAHGART